MDEQSRKRVLVRALRRCSALTAAMLLVLAGAACDPDKQAVPDPEKPPMPKIEPHQ